MRYRLSSPRFRRRRLLEAALMCLLLLLAAAPVSVAQSGRRPPKPPTSPDPLPPKQEEPPIKPSSERNSKSGIPVTVSWHLGSVTSSTIYTHLVEEGCLERLSQADSVKASAAEEMNRKQAIDLAKGSPDTYVLWFELEVDSSYQGRSGIDNVPPQYLNVRFEVYTPGTGKTKTGGYVYQRSRAPGGLPLPVPGGTVGSAQYLLRNAGREMADRLFDALGLSRPSDRH
jgi:hypothetical protein